MKKSALVTWMFLSTLLGGTWYNGTGILLSQNTEGYYPFGQDSILFTYFDHVLFYDVYAGTVSNEDAPVPEGLNRLNNSRYARPIPQSDLDLMGDTLRLDVTLNPSCDNYDRIAGVAITLQPKGTTYYNDCDATTPDGSHYLGRLGSTDPTIRRIEIGRFITPFMDKNKTPDAVPYSWDISFLSALFHDKALLDTTDIWIELVIEGVPYAANQQISGCAGRNDVFYGSASIVSNVKTTGSGNDGENNGSECIVEPFCYQRYLNSYQKGHTDESGTLTAHYTMQVEEDLEDAFFLFINSNHGANSGGEEYNRRLHYVFVNEWMAMVYRPGRTSCEPYRKYNTQANGIYSGTFMSDESWQSFSNWCPGDKIDNRIIHLGAIQKGEYDFRLLVPDAVFNGNEGYFPFSLTFFGLKHGKFTQLNEIEESKTESMHLVWNGEKITLEGDNLKNVTRWELLDSMGQKLMAQPGNAIDINMGNRSTGVYILVTEFEGGEIEVHKFFKK